MSDTTDTMTSTASPLLSCRGIDMAYGPVQILFGVDFDVQQGEIVALLVNKL
jgi:ABC-type sugar transport system ATPase subunit